MTELESRVLNLEGRVSLLEALTETATLPDENTASGPRASSCPSGSTAAGSLQNQPQQAESGSSGTRPETPWAAIREELTALFGAPTNKHERGRRAKAISLIAESIGETDVDARWEIRSRHKRWASVFPSATITDIALGSRWSDLKPPARRLAANEKPGWYEDDRFVPNPELVKSWGS